jgi:hypothetical protein
MNIDDFLDQTSEPDTSDVIDISIEDTTPEVIAPTPPEIVKEVSDIAIPRPTSSHAKKSEEGIDITETRTISTLGDTKEVFSTPQKSPAATLVQKIRMHVTNINSALQKADIGEALRVYSKLVSLTQKIPSSNVSAKHRVDTLLLNTNNDIQKIVSGQKTYCVVTSKKIELLIARGIDLLLGRNSVGAQKVYAEVSKLFQTLPVYFSDEKHEVNTRIIQFHLKLTNYKKRETSARFKQEFAKIKSLLYDLSMLMAGNKFVEARKLYKDIEYVYSTMEEGFLDERSKIYTVMLKKKHKIDVAIQIQSLQNELGVKPMPVFEQKSVPLARLPIPGVTRTIVVPEPISVVPVHIEPMVLSQKVVQSEPLNPSLKQYSKDSLINEAIKNVKLSKIKILLMDQQFAQAFLLLSELRKRFPDDAGVYDAYSQLKNDPHAPATEALRTEAAYVAQELKRVDTDLAKGNLSRAIKDLELIESEEQNVELKGILKDLETAISHKPGQFEKEDAKFIRRKLLLAKHHYDKHNFSKTKEYVSLVLTHDPKNREAKKLYALVS